MILRLKGPKRQEKLPKHVLGKVPCNFLLRRAGGNRAPARGRTHELKAASEHLPRRTLKTASCSGGTASFTRGVLEGCGKAGKARHVMWSGSGLCFFGGSSKSAHTRWPQLNEAVAGMNSPAPPILKTPPSRRRRRTEPPEPDSRRSSRGGATRTAESAAPERCTSFREPCPFTV